MRITEAQIEQIRDANNIVDVVSETVRLRVRGRNHLGLCPFHNEKTPSFNVLPERGIFKCFGCGKGGDVFGFIMELEHVTFPEAVERLAQRANIPLDRADPEQEREHSERESIHVAIRAAAAFYYRSLRREGGKVAMQYLASRAIGEVALKRFGVGFAPPISGLLTEQMTAEGISEESLERAGVISPGSQGRPYERFRGRLIFPIFSATGRIVGFGGRVLPDVDTVSAHAKYINSPETPIYSKSHNLYGLFQAKDAIRKAQEAYLVEGYLDVIAMSQAGFENVVAASGTSLTAGQLEVLKRFTTNVVLLFDADKAGKSAAMRGIELALEAGFDVNCVVLPMGEDPESYIRTNGRDAFAEAVARRQSFIETKAQILAEQGMLDDPAHQAQAIHSIVDSIALIPDAIKQELFIRKLATRFRLSETMLLSELSRSRSARNRGRSLHRTELPDRRQAEAAGALTDDDARVLNRDEFEVGMSYQSAELEVRAKAERVLLEAALISPRVIQALLERDEFELTLIQNRQIAQILKRIFDYARANEAPTVTMLLDAFRNDEAAQRIVLGNAEMDDQESAGWEATEKPPDTVRATQMAEQAMIVIFNSEIRIKLEALKQEIAGSPEEANDVLEHVQHLSMRYETLKQRFSGSNRDEFAKHHGS